MWRMALLNPHFQIQHHIHTPQDMYIRGPSFSSINIQTSYNRIYKRKHQWYGFWIANADIQNAGLNAVS